MLRQTCLFLLLFRGLLTPAGNCEDDLFKRVYNALNKVLDFIYENRHYMNIDGLFGLVLAKAQLQDTIPAHLNFRDALNHARSKTSKILSATDFAKLETNSKNKLFIKYLLDEEIWKKNITFRFGELTNITNISSKEFKTCKGYLSYLRNSYFSEELFDQCLLELIESSIVKLNDCQTSKLCSSYLVNTGYYTPGYGITHRLLYLQVSKARHCICDKEWLKAKIRKYCSFIFWEAQKNADCEFIPQLDDLFLEQMLLCGYEGFMEFLSRSWMEHVLSIQTEQGCFGVSESLHSHKNELKRKKRETNVIKFGCTDHTTGLGVGVLSLILRFLSETTKKVNCF